MIEGRDIVTAVICSEHSKPSDTDQPAGSTPQSQTSLPKPCPSSSVRPNNFSKSVCPRLGDVVETITFRSSDAKLWFVLL
jgi:hypothetical protein